MLHGKEIQIKFKRGRKTTGKAEEADVSETNGVDADGNTKEDVINRREGRVRGGGRRGKNKEEET